MMIAGYLLFARLPEACDGGGGGGREGRPSAAAALAFFRTARTTDLDAVNQPSQVRHVHCLPWPSLAFPRLRSASLAFARLRSPSLTFAHLP